MAFTCLSSQCICYVVSCTECKALQFFLHILKQRPECFSFSVSGKLKLKIGRVSVLPVRLLRFSVFNFVTSLFQFAQTKCKLKNWETDSVSSVWPNRTIPISKLKTIQGSNLAQFFAEASPSKFNKMHISIGHDQISMKLMVRYLWIPRTGSSDIGGLELAHSFSPSLTHFSPHNFCNIDS